MAKVKKILIFDDDKDFIKLTIAKLSAKNISATGSTSIKNFVQAYQSEPWDLILIDLNLDQGLSGFDLIRTIREKQKKYIPIVLISRDQDKEKIAHGIECGADDYLFKPIDYTIALPKFSYLVTESVSQKYQLEMIRVPQPHDQASISVAFEVQSISEVGLTLRSKNYINKGSFIEVSGDVLASFIGIDSLRLRVGKTELANGFYIMLLNWPENADFIPYLRTRINNLKGST